MGLKPIEFWRKRIEENPGSVRLLGHTYSVEFTPFFFAGGMAHGKDDKGDIVCWSLETYWREAKHKVVRWLWAAPSGAISLNLMTQDDHDDSDDIYTRKLEWSRTEFEE